MKSILERLMYVTLLLLFLGGALMFLILFNQSQKLDQELQALKTIQVNQAKAVEQLNSSVDALKADNDHNLAVVICMLQIPVSQRTTDIETNCRTQLAATTPIQTIVPSPTPTSQPSPVPKPVVTNKPSPQQNLFNRLLNNLGL